MSPKHDPKHLHRLAAVTYAESDRRDHDLCDRRLLVQERDANNIGKMVYTRGRDLSGSLEEAEGIGGLLARSEPATLNRLLQLGGVKPYTFY